ncbi:DUF771 domain-containing protein [Peribacillus loiseleuriae]|uniref:DUF771 domain-containing protein n=1 Tax=Peribacillus loiseleuriae TaxID=1679170 RepID=UPI003D010529
MQQLKINLSVTIPDNYVLIENVEYEQLKQSELKGVYWNMKDLEARTTRKSEWIKENILYPPRFRKFLDAENGGFVFYPKSKGQTWVFQASKMAAFLDNHFNQIFNR